MLHLRGTHSLISRDINNKDAFWIINNSHYLDYYNVSTDWMIIVKVVAQRADLPLRNNIPSEVPCDRTTQQHHVFTSENQTTENKPPRICKNLFVI